MNVYFSDLLVKEISPSCKLLYNKSDKNKYTLITVALCKDGVKKVFTVSRLVALVFLPNPENKLTVDHIDRDTSNNCVENLQWATHAEQNDNKSFKIGKSGHKNICKTEVGQHWIVRIMRNYKLVYCKQFDTIEDAIKARDDFLASPLSAS
jgi:hypothetical protein